MVTPTTPAHRIAGVVSQALEVRGLTVVALSDATGIPRTTLIRRLSGRSPFTVNELGEVADALGMTSTEILTAAEPAA